MKRMLLLAGCVGAASHAQYDNHAHPSDPTPANDAQIIVTINPEARVSTAVAAPMPPPRPCGEVTELRVNVLNQGFVTAPLRARIVGEASNRVALHLDATKLSGEPKDARLLHLIPLVAEATDVTLAFSIDNTIGDLGGRDRIHLLVRCMPGDDK